MKEEIIQLLNDASDYVSGEDISNQLGVSRTAIWKVMKQLKELGYEIEAITKKGYKLIESPDVLNSEEIHYNLKSELFGKKIITHKIIGSTNQEGKKLAMEGEVEGTLIIAEEQSEGKGRRGRGWISPPNTGIWMSLILRPAIEPRNASILTLVAGLAVCLAIKEITNLKPAIKWPNDIVIEGKKVSGVLTEMSSEIDYVNFVIVGIGINVNTPSFQEELRNIATSLMLVEGKTYKRKELVKKILEIFEELYYRFLKTEDLKLMIVMYNELCINIGRKVIVTGRNGTISGKVTKITEKGELVLIDDTGEERIINSGEVSVRGLGRYV